jgi:prolyl oligopeptidase
MTGRRITDNIPCRGEAPRPDEVSMALHCTGRFNLVACLFLLATATHSHGVEKMATVQPRAAIRVEQTNLGEIKIVDPYRWMENADSPEFAAWVKGQDDYTRAVLEANTQREQITKRIVELAHNQDEVSDVKRRSGGLFYLRRPANGDRYRLMVRGKDGAERVLLDPAADLRPSPPTETRRQ